MNSFERRNKIVDMVNTQGSVLVLDLSNLFGISDNASVRKFKIA